MSEEFNVRIAACEAKLARQTRLSAIAWSLLTILLVVSIGERVITPRQTAAMAVSELTVVDQQGTVRVRIGGDLPDAIVDGRPTPRGEKAAGLLLYDETGQERGGYVTWEPSGNVGLTLDTRHGQSALFVADPEEGTALQIWHANDLLELRSDGNGSRLTAVKEGAVVFQQPPISLLDDEACAAYRGALAKFSLEEVMEACRKRFPAEACEACLSQTPPGQ